jgi:hypothetical protein
MTTLFYGFIFGVLLQSARLNRFDTISGMATLENFKVAKAIALAIGVGVILVNIEIGLGLASYHIKPFLLGGIVLGGLIFGTGMAILGYCPGTVMVSAGEGSLDAMVGILGGLAGGLAYTLVLPSVSILLGPNIGTWSLYTALGDSPLLFYPVMLLCGLLFIGAAFVVHRLDKSHDKSWIIAGTGIAILAAIVFHFDDRPIGASTFFPYVADNVFGVVNNDYFRQISKPGRFMITGKNTKARTSENGLSGLFSEDLSLFSAPVWQVDVPPGILSPVGYNWQPVAWPLPFLSLQDYS